MALRNYSLLKGKVIDLALDDDDSPHIELLIEADGVKYRAAINVRSKISPHDLLFLRKKNYDNHQLTQALSAAPVGLSDVRNDIQQLAIDYVHGGLFTKQDMKIAMILTFMSWVNLGGQSRTHGINTFIFVPVMGFTMSI